MLKRAIIPGYGPFVFGRKSRLSSNGPGQGFFSTALMSQVPVVPTPPILDAIRQAAKSLYPIYSAEENILANDRFGDCTCAGMLHIVAIQQAMFHANWRLPGASDALWLYSKVTSPPFNLATGTNDNGADLKTVLDFCRLNGSYSDGSGRISGYVSVDATSQADLRGALDQYGTLYLGGALPDAWVNENPPVWDVAGPSNPDNGHCVIAFGDNDNGLRIDTWGEFKILTWKALEQYFSSSASGEVYAFDLME